MTWIPITDGMPVPRGSEYRSDGHGGWGYNPNADGDGLTDCNDPVARINNGELTWECTSRDCIHDCGPVSVEDPTNPGVFTIDCKCPQL